MIGVGISAGLTGAKRARSIQDPLPALDLDWATDRSLPAAYGPTPSFSRASTGTFFNSSGTLTTAAINAPRFNHVYNGSSWVSKGLLVEEQRTNSVTKSNTFSAWSKNDAVVTSDSTTAPDGTANGDLVTFTASGAGLSRVIQISGFSNISGTTYTKSIFVKSGTQRYFQIVFGSPFSSKFANFDTQDKVAATVSAGVTTSVTDCGNGWFRYSASVAATVTSSADQFWIYAVDSGTATWAPSSSTGGTMWLFGAQYETGDFATSFIASDSGTAVTRSADVCQITGGDFSSFWNASEGSFVTEADSIGFASTGSDRYIIAFNSSGTANIAHAIFLPTTGLSFDVYNSTLQARVSYTQPNAGDSFKLASCYKANDFAATLNGSAVQTDTSGTVPTINNVGIGHYPSFNQYANCHIARLRYYPTRLTNAKLQELST